MAQRQGDSYDLASGLRDRLSDGERPDPVTVVPELQRLVRQNLDGPVDIRVHAWSVGRKRRADRRRADR